MHVQRNTEVGGANTDAQLGERGWVRKEGSAGWEGRGASHLATEQQRPEARQLVQKFMETRNIVQTL